MSLHDEDEYVVDINNNNMLTDEDTYSLNDKQDTSTTSSQPNDSFFRDLFNVYDTEQLGYIHVANFIQISKQNMADNFLGDANKLKEIVGLLDPTGCGRIQYCEFIEGMTRLMSEKSEGYVEGHELISRSRSSTFMEGETPVLQLHKNLTEEIFENYGPDTPNSSNKTSSNEFDFVDNENDSESLHESESCDLFGLDSSAMKNHRKSVSLRKSISMGGLVRDSRRLSMQNRVDTMGNHGEYGDEHVDNCITGGNEDSVKYEQIIGNLELKIKNIDIQNENLKYEINEQINRNQFHTNENSNLILKIREFEDHNAELERKFQSQINEENRRHQEAFNKVCSKQLEDREHFINQIRNLELAYQEQKLQNSTNLKQIDELSNLCDEKEILLIQESTKLKETTTQYKNSLAEIESLVDSRDRLKLEFEEHTDQFTKEIHELTLDLTNSKQEQTYQRKSTLYDENYYLNQIKQLDLENVMFKNEIQNLSACLEEQQASLKIYKTKNVSNMEDLSSLSSHGQIMNNGFMQVSNTQESFLSECSGTKEEELLEKLIEEKKNVQRLRDYVEELTSKILEHNPAILESSVAYTPQVASVQIIKNTSKNAKPEKTSFKSLFKFVK